MNEIDYLRHRADELRAASETAHDPDVVRALQDVAAEFDQEAQIEAAQQPGSWPDQRRARTA